MANSERGLFNFKKAAKIAMASGLTLLAGCVSPTEKITATSTPIRIGSATSSALYQETPAIPPLPSRTETTVFFAPSTPTPPTMPAESKTEVSDAIPPKEHRPTQQVGLNIVVDNILIDGTSTIQYMNDDLLNNQEVKVDVLGGRTLMARGQAGKFFDDIIADIDAHPELVKNVQAVVVYPYKNSIRRGDTAESLKEPTKKFIKNFHAKHPDKILLIVNVLPSAEPESLGEEKIRETKEMNDFLLTLDGKDNCFIVDAAAKMARVEIVNGKTTIILYDGFYRNDQLHLTPNRGELKNINELTPKHGLYQFLLAIREKLDAISLPLRKNMSNLFNNFLSWKRGLTPLQS